MESDLTTKEKMQSSWWDRNKKKVLIAGGTAICVVGCLLIGQTYLRKNKTPIVPPQNDFLKTAVDKKTMFENVRLINGEEPFDVRRHLRNLPEGWRASAQKIAQACEENIELAEHQTWVEKYTKNAA